MTALRGPSLARLPCSTPTSDVRDGKQQEKRTETLAHVTERERKEPKVPFLAPLRCTLDRQDAGNLSHG